ncbi:conserved hypothetical protein [Hyphomicrobiales bacterium]|jgi:hypothetical protein|nr:conserved hypothetical protein [Hyphomicrobiales bacterium]CAH1702583.1 hypothetical protein BOSEA1005_30455 [Hyphomicrobiales bacterium]CAI0346786.1 conserved hypothetical protein [Hyphomicrobiales bacterium]
MATQDEVESREGMLARMIGEQASNAVLNSRRIVPKRHWTGIIDEASKRFLDPKSPISGTQVRLFMEDVLKRDGVPLLSPRGLFILFVDSRIRRRDARTGGAAAGR